MTLISTVIKASLFCLCVSFHLCSSAELSSNLSKNVYVSALIAFGDSLVDQGNNNDIVTLANAHFLPYGRDFQGGKPTGRWGNGRTLADFIGSALGVKEYLPAYRDPTLQDKDLLTGVSFASGGTGFDPLTSIQTSVISPSAQLNMFKQYKEKLKKIAGEEAANNIITNGVYLVVAGNNDIFVNYYIFSIRRFQYDIRAYNTMLVDLATSFVQEVYKLGARKIAVFSTLPLGCLPAARTLAGGELRKCVKEYTKSAEMFNSMLKAKIHYLASVLPDSKVVFVDMYNRMIDIMENPQKYGFEITDKACCGSGKIEVSFLCNRFLPTCRDSSKFFFWDSFHPSEKGYHVLVDLILPDLMKTLSDDNSNFTGA